MHEQDDRKDAREYRLKQLEFLIKIVDSETERVARMAKLLVVGNAGAIGVSLIILKDLRAHPGSLGS
jgi:hypothetical protein